MREKDIHVGDLSGFQSAEETADTGIVKEDRGPIGIKGRRLYLIHLSLEPSILMQLELPAEKIELVAAEGVSLGRGS